MPGTRVGFTGTRKGLTGYQRHELFQVLDELRKPPFEFHHGDCVGADEEAAGLAQQLGYRIVIHPPENKWYRAFCSADQILAEKPYLDRNRDIVDASDLVIACPGGEKMVLRSGTWATVRYALKQGKHTIIIHPSGRRKEQGNGNSPGTA